jgi:hypothetical protein
MIILIILGSYLFFIKGYGYLPVGDGSRYDQGENAIWLSRDWLREPPDKMPEAVLRQKLADFRKRGIKYLYPHCCPMDEEGNLPEINHETAERLIRLAGEYGGYFQILPWVGGSIATVDLSDMEQGYNYILLRHNNDRKARGRQ